MKNQNRVILDDALSTIENFAETFRLKSRSLRESEQKEMLARIEDDIRTVLKTEEYHPGKDGF